MKFVTMIFAIIMAGTVSAQEVKVDGLTFKIGDDVATVKTALHTKLDPEKVDNGLPAPFNTGQSVLHLRTKGIWVFFNKKDTVTSIKFDEPYAGTIAGVKLGDSEKNVRAVLGKPVKAPWAFGTSQAFLYVLDDTAYVRFDIADADGVRAIYIQK